MQPVELPTRLLGVHASELEGKATVRSEGQLAVRAKPDQTADIIAYLEPGQRAKPLARNPDDGWLMITFGANLGWIPIDSIVWDGPLENLPVLPQS
jgi:SH3-like domain-containing protein